MQSGTPKILVIRRDNIGDLICTTPVFEALRRKFPSAQLCALVNSYNAPVLNGNPFIDQVFVYTKAKHEASLLGRLNAWWARLQLTLRLRRIGFDYIILGTPGWQARAYNFARLLGAKKIIGYVTNEKPASIHLDIEIPFSLPRTDHEVDRAFGLLQALDIVGPPPRPYLAVDETIRAAVEQRIEQRLAATNVRGPLVAVHISVRKPPNRWPVENFAQIINRIWQEYRLPILLLWAPGDENNLMHPGDDRKAAHLQTLVTPDVPLIPMPTHHLHELIAALACCHMHVCLDGGAMHIGAAVGKPTLALFGNDDPNHWHPYGVPYVVRQSPTMQAVNISVDEAMAGFRELVKANPGLLAP